MARRLGWRVLGGNDAAAADGATNMALDAALLERVRDGAPPLLRLYRWTPPTLSFGRNQPAAGLYDEAAARDRGIAFVRRPTGGQAVLHADEVTYAVVAPVDVIGRPRDAYRRINEALVAGLRGLGVDAAVAGSGTQRERPRGAHAHPHTHRRAIDWGAACFRDPAEGEVVVGGRKLVGSAQRCERRVILQHGSILVSGSQVAAEELLLGAPDRMAAGDAGGVATPGWTTLEAELGRRPSAVSLAGAVADGFREVLGTRLARADLSIGESKRAEDLRDTFASPGWTWRR